MNQTKVTRDLDKLNSNFQKIVFGLVGVGILVISFAFFSFNVGKENKLLVILSLDLVLLVLAYFLTKFLLVKLKEFLSEEEKRIESVLSGSKNLINNMRQSVFAINSDLIIIEPVSTFSDTIFGERIVGKNIFDVVYSSLQPQSSECDQIKNFFEIVFGESELQWDLEEDNLLRRVVLDKIIKGRAVSQILKINHRPVFNESDELTRIMFVIEDITEIERLEKKMKSQQEEKNIEITLIKELAQVDVNDVRDFFRRAPFYVTAAWEILDKGARNPEEQEELFRNLHTLKGNSRIFKFERLSKSVHDVEEIVKNACSKDSAVVLDLKNEEIFEGLMGIQKILSKYGELAQRVFKIENEFKSSMIHQIIESFSEVDYLLNPTRFTESEKVHLYLSRLKKKMQNELILEISENFLKIRQLAQNLGMDLSSKVSLNLMNEWNTGRFEHFYENYRVLLNDIMQLYYHSSLLKSYPDGPEVWAPILKHIVVFFNNYSRNNYILDSKDKKFSNSLSVIWSDANSQSFLLLENFAGRLNDLFSTESEKAFVFLAQDMLRYICFLMDINIDQNLDSKGKEELIAILDGIQNNKNIDPLLNAFEYANVNITTLIRIIIREEFDLFRFFKELNVFLNKSSYIELFPSLSNNKKLKQSDFQLIIDQLWELDDLSGVEDHPFKEMVKSLLFSGFKKDLMVQRLDIIQILDGYMETEDSIRRKSNLQMVQIVATNLNQLKNSINELKVDFTQNKLEFLEKTFNHLLDIPVKKAFLKFSDMVEEISSKLGKKVDFNIRGDDFVLNRDSLTLLTDSLVHILRNSLDHGIEHSEERINHGKDERGQLEIVCFDYNDKLVFEIRDDGRGIDPEKIKESAIRKNILTLEEAEKLSEEKILNIIFEPAFSTAEKVTHLSGRGVGMNVVKENIEKLGGKILIMSEKGEGTEFVVTLKKA